jgi:hypothetical protein
LKWLGKHIIDSVTRLRNDVYIDKGNLTIYNPVINTDPEISLGASDDERLRIKINYQGTGSTSCQIASFKTYTASGTANDGRFDFYVDEVWIAKMLDTGIELQDGMKYSFSGTSASFAEDTFTFDSVGITAIQTSAEAFANNDTSLMTSAAIEDKIENYGYGDITGVRITADDSNVASQATGSADFTIAGGSGISTSASGTTITIASSSSAAVDSVSAGDGIDVSSTTGDVIVTAETASVTNPGIVELATTGEAETGTDTARAVTPEGLKHHVDTRYTRSIITFMGQGVMRSDGNWIIPAQYGISSHSWNTDSGVNTETNGSTTASIAKQQAGSGIRVPHACVIESLYCGIRNNSGNRQVTAGLFVGNASAAATMPQWGTTDAAAPILQIHADANNEGGSYTNRPVHAEATGEIPMAAGDMIYPGIKLTGVTGSGNTDSVGVSFSIGIKTLIH